MDKLPNELLSYIFSLLMALHGQDPSSARTLSHVCSGWRRVSLSTGSLWTRINIALPLNERQQKWAEIYLNRSIPYSLEILIDVRDPNWDWNEENHSATWQAMIPTIHLLIPHSQRWRKFEMLTDNWEPIFTFLFYTKAKLIAPKLEVLSLSRCNAYLAAIGQAFHPERLRAPIRLLGGLESALDSLTTVILVGVHVEWQNSVLRNLSRLELKYQSSDVMPNVEQFRRIVEDSPTLGSLAIVGWGPILDLSETYPEGMFLFPALKELTFGFVDVNYATRLLSLFHVPSLQLLVLEDINPVVSPINGENATPLLDLISSTSSITPTTTPSPLLPIHISAVSHLELRWIRAENRAFSDFFKKLVHLRYLSYVNMLDDAVDCLCRSTPIDDRALCPQLAELHCVDVNPDALIRLARSRRIDVDPRWLQKISISFLPNRLLSLEPGVLESLQSSGIEVVELGQDI